MNEITILWADDEIDLLKPHIMFLEDKGYNVLACQSGDEALDEIMEKRVDIVFLDENMPGLSGLETLSQIKSKKPHLPVVMITKSEEESIMEDAIGAKISDYLIKPVNPKQILLSVKKNLDTSRLVSEKATTEYQQQFSKIGMRLNENLNKEEWVDLYKKLVYWELELGSTEDSGMDEILQMQKSEANLQFSKFIASNYTHWLNNPDDAPVMSHTLIKNKVIPVIEEEEGPVFLILIDNLRYDQWEIIRPLISEYFWVDKEEAFYSILPTTTHYSRNALFSGLLPSEIEKRFPDKWVNDDEEGGKNQYEEDFLEFQLKQYGINTFSYHKVLNHDFGKMVNGKIPNLMNNKLNVIVYNFVDMLSHARTDTEIIRELADDESAYRSLTLSWFEHSPLLEAIKQLSDKKAKVIITTDHGSIRVKDPVKVVGDRETNPNLRYKQGKNLNYNEKEVFEVQNPEDALLPKLNVSQRFIFATEDHFFAYPNNYNYYVKYYKDTFQHGGVSLEEMIIPTITLTAK